MSPGQTDLREDERVDQKPVQSSEAAGPQPERRQMGRDQGEEGSPRWRRFVIPYQYYGPGYRGVGYYSVFYMGSDEPNGEQGDGSFDQDSARYAAGGGAGSTAAPQRHGSSRGGYAGRGPKGYQRSDERIREEISDRLMADDDLDASNIEVLVDGGEVTLTGTVEDRQAKRLAELIAESAMGVQDVMNNTRVASAGQGSPNYDATGRPSGRSGANETRTATSRSSGSNGQRGAKED